MLSWMFVQKFKNLKELQTPNQQIWSKLSLTNNLYESCFESMMWHNVLRHHAIAIICIIIFCPSKEERAIHLSLNLINPKTQNRMMMTNFWRNGYVRNTFEVLRKFPLKIIRMWAINTLSSLSNVADDWKSYKMDTLLKNLLNVEINAVRTQSRGRGCLAIVK